MPFPTPGAGELRISRSSPHESMGQPPQSPGSDDDIRAGKRFARLLDPESRGDGEVEQDGDSQRDDPLKEPHSQARGAAREDASTSRLADEQQGFQVSGSGKDVDLALPGKSGEAFERLVADLRVKSAREKLLLTPKTSSRVHERISPAHVAKLAMLAGQVSTKGAMASAQKRSNPEGAITATPSRDIARRADAQHIAHHRDDQGAESVEQLVDDSPYRPARGDEDPAAREGRARSRSPQDFGQRGEVQKVTSPRETLDTVVSKLHRAEQLPVRDPAATPRVITTRQMLPARQYLGARVADLAQARTELVRMKATQTGGVLELDIGVEHTERATLRLEIEDGKARAICRCRAPEALGEVQKMVDSIREVLSRAGMELDQVDVQLERDGGSGDGSREHAKDQRSDNGREGSHARRDTCGDDDLEVIVSGLIHVIG